MSEHERRLLFEAWAERYDQIVRSEKGFPFEGYSRVLERIVELASPTETTSVLDVGVGTGNLAKLFAQTTVHLSGIDFSHAMIERVEKALPDGQWYCADVMGEWPRELSGTYDRIVSTYLFHEFPPERRHQLIKKLIDHYLKPNGMVLIGDIGFPNREAHNAGRSQWKDAWDSEEYYWVVDEELASLRSYDITLEYEQLSRCAFVATYRMGS